MHPDRHAWIKTLVNTQIICEDKRSVNERILRRFGIVKPLGVMIQDPRLTSLPSTLTAK